jgi:uncharacterized protein
MQASTHDFKPKALDIQAFARAGAQMHGSTALAEMPRLAACSHGVGEEHPAPLSAQVHWQAQGELRERVGSPAEIWLHIQAQASLPLTCQRCLQATEQALSVDRSFRFVSSESEAAEEDADAEEDVLVLNRKFKLLELVEDELLLDLPVIARHDVCPDPLPLPAGDLEMDEDPTEPAPNPFAMLEALKKPRPGGH